MSRIAIAIIIVLVASAAWPAPARADEPYLEFARALRARGMPDLAVDYLQRLSAQPPAGLAEVLPLELAKARLDMAAREGDARRRDAQFQLARAAFEQFLRSGTQNPKAVEARLELARLIGVQGRLLLDQARRQESKATQRDRIARAKPQFADAAIRLQEAIAALDDRVQKSNDAVEKSELARLRLQARLEEGKNLVYQAMIAADLRDQEQRIDLVKRANEVLTQLSGEDSAYPTAWQAKLWLGRLAEEEEDKVAARRTYESLAGEKSSAAEEAARVAAYLLLRLQARDDAVVGGGSTRLPQLLAGCEDWLKRYRNAVDSPEGQGVRFLLATALEQQGMAGATRSPQPGDPPRVGTSARPSLQRAERLLKELTDTENDFTDRARSRRTGILFVLMADRGRDLNPLANFEECYLVAQVEAFELNEGKLPPAEHGRRQMRVIAALRRALALAGRGDVARDVADARVMLVYAYLVNDQPYAAAVLGEHLGRTGDAGARSPDAVAYALQAYADIVAEDRSRHAGDDEIKADQQRLRSLAGYMETTWPEEAVTDIARHQLGIFLIDDGSFADAIAMLARIGPGYAGLAQARYQEGAAARRAQGTKVNLSAAQKSDLLHRAIADLDNTPGPEAAIGVDSALAACMAKLQLGNLLLLDERSDGTNYERAEALGKSIAELAPRLGLEAQFATQVQAEATRLRAAGMQGQALTLLHADKVAEARALLAPLVRQVRQELADPKAADAPEPLREAQRQVLLTALRAAIQENATDRASQMLALLRQITPAAGLDSANDRLLSVVRDLKQEADALKSKGATVQRDRLEKGLVALLDELAKPKQLTLDVRLLLAQAFSSADRHDRAAELLEAAPQPKPGDEDAMHTFQLIRLALAREYRLGRQFPRAKQVLDDALATWGQNSLDVRKEVVALLEDNGSFSAAVQMCRDIQRSLERSRSDYERAMQAEHAAEEAERTAKTDAERAAARTRREEAQARRTKAQPLREAYWQFYFEEVRAVFKSDLKRAKDAADKEQRLGAIARAIKRLEDGQDDFGGGDMRAKYRELVESDPVLKKKYVEVGGRRLYDEAAR